MAGRPKSTVKLRGALPPQKLNGLAAHGPYILEHDEDVFYAVVKLGVAEERTTVLRDAENAGTRVQVPHMEVLACELVTDEPGLTRVKELYQQAYFERTGDGALTLPFPTPQEQNGLTPTSGIPAPSFAAPEDPPGVA